MRFRQLAGACAAALLATACSLGTDGDASSIQVFLEIDKNTVPSGESVTITVTARNVGDEPLTLAGPSDCLLFTEILNSQGQLVWNSNSACTGSTVTESLAAGQEKVRSFVWDGINLTGTQVPGGFYVIRGLVSTAEMIWSGQPVSIEVGS